MSNEKWYRWFKEKYPNEEYMQQEIVKRIEEIFKTYPDSMEEGKIINVTIGMSHNPITGKLGIVINPIGTMFLGALGKAVLDSLTAHFEGLLSSGIGEQLVEKKVTEVIMKHTEKSSLQNSKSCLKCGTIHPMNAKYCMECASPFPS